MGLITEKPTAAFDLTQIGHGCLLWAKHFSWEESGICDNSSGKPVDCAVLSRY